MLVANVWHWWIGIALVLVSVIFLVVVGVVLIIVGALGLIYGGFSYTQDNTAVKIGPLELTVQEKKSINIPLWAGIGALVVGVVLVGVGGKSR